MRLAPCIDLQPYMRLAPCIDLQPYMRLAPCIDLQPTSTAGMVGKPLKDVVLLSVRMQGVDLRLRKFSPGVTALVDVLLRVLRDGVCPLPGSLITGMLRECWNDTLFFEGVPCTALILSSKPLRSCTPCRRHQRQGVL